MLAVIWLSAATIRPETTYHLAPLLVAGAVPLLSMPGASAPASRAVAAAALGGAGLALGSTGVLAGLGNLEGPSLLPFGGAAAESILFSLVGSIAGFGGAVMRLRR